MTAVLFATDSFKGSLTSVQVGQALAAGWARARPGDRLLHAPLADGGEGTLEAVAAAGGWTWQRARVTDPIGRPIEARWLRSDDGRRGVIEMAEASGLSRLGAEERDPINATSVGTGELLCAAVDAGVRHITLGIGGSATTDGGRGMLEPLRGPIRHERFDDFIDPRMREVDLAIACDVTNPLLGPSGAAAVYGPQKGASPAQVRELEDRLGRWAREFQAFTGTHEADTPGAGAAGGVGFALLSIRPWFRSVDLRPGIELLMAATGFEAKLAEADLVVTGEGRIDAQTAFGKTALGVARRARAAGVACVAVGGSVEPEGADTLAGLGVATLSVIDRPQTVEAAMAAGPVPLERAGERLARLLGIGASL